MTDNNSDNPYLKLNILVVQSESPLGERIRAILSAEGYVRVVAVETARGALSILRTQPIDVLICDIDLDELDGWRLSRLVRSGVLRCSATIPIIVTTSTWCERIAEVTAREYGISGLISIEDLDTLPSVLWDCLSAGFKVTKPQLLVVEDEEDTAELIRRILTVRFDVEIATDGQAGLNAWLARRHDLVLLDVMLPIMEGPEVLEGILSEKPNQPVVIMTAHAPVEQAEELLIRGAADFISKPFRPDQLRSVTEIALRRDDYLVSNDQFALRVRSLAEREAAFREVSEIHSHLLNNLQTVVMELDSELNITFVNEAWCRLMGFSSDESLNQPFKEFLADKDGRKYRSVEGRFKAVLAGERDTSELELRLQDSRQQEHWAQLRVSCYALDDQQPRLTICLDDITRRKQALEQLEHLAMHDSLTGLYNRHYFERLLQNLAKDAKRNHQVHGLIYMDLDYFKVINDTYGHHQGDDVLRQVAQVVETHIRSTDVFCRFGGDEFALILHNLESSTDNPSLDKSLLNIADLIKTAVSEHPFRIGNQAFHLGCSIGVSLIDGTAIEADGYLMQADIALYVAKHRGRNLVHMYNPEDRESEELRMNVDWSRQIRQAMLEDRLVLYFQPIIEIANNTVAYYEALIRMRDIDDQIIMPGKFIAALESTGEMGLLDRWVIKRAIAMLSEYPQLSNIAINLSAQAFRDDNLVPIIRESLEANQVNGSSITFELTESASLFDIKVTRRVIKELHQLGCSFAIDDFGSGFSSFAYLKELPADYIKLDGSFIRNLHQDKVDQALVRSIIEVIHTLGRKTVAEFVENQEILDFLADNGVHYAQGYHIGKPVPVTELAQGLSAKYRSKE